MPCDRIDLFSRGMRFSRMVRFSRGVSFSRAVWFSRGVRSVRGPLLGCLLLFNDSVGQRTPPVEMSRSMET